LQIFDVARRKSRFTIVTIVQFQTDPVPAGRRRRRQTLKALTNTPATDSYLQLRRTQIGA